MERCIVSVILVCLVPVSRTRVSVRVRYLILVTGLNRVATSATGISCHAVTLVFPTRRRLQISSPPTSYYSVGVAEEGTRSSTHGQVVEYPTNHFGSSVTDGIYTQYYRTHEVCDGTSMCVQAAAIMRTCHMGGLTLNLSLAQRG